MILVAVVPVLLFVLFRYVWSFLSTRRTILAKIDSIPEFPFASNFKDFFHLFIYPQSWKSDNFHNIQQQILKKFIETHFDPVNSKIGIFKNTFFILPTLHITRPEVAEGIFRSNHVLKPYLYSFSHDFIGRGLVTSNGSKWKHRRKMLTPAFHFKILQDFLPIMKDQTLILTQILDKKIEEKEGLVEDLLDVVQRCTLDIICESAMGTQVQAQHKQNVKYVDALTTVVDLITRRVFKPLHYIDWFYRYFTRDGSKFYRSLKVMDDMITDVIAKRKHEVMNERMKRSNNDVDDVDARKPFTRRAFLHSLIDYHLDSPTEFTEEDIREEVNTFMFAGHDTTAIALTMAIWLIGLHPSVQETIQEELDQVFPCASQEITLDNLRQLKYLEAVVKESLRLFPSVTFIGRRLTQGVSLQEARKTRREGEEITHIPPGIDTFTLPYVLHRCPDHWPDPERFNPNRFLDPLLVKTRHPFAYIPFAAGARNCVGQKFAQQEEKAILASLFRKFTVRSLDGRDKISVTPNLTIHPNQPIRVVFQKRTVANNNL
jgi:cytochrome P450